ncbi:MAG: rane protein [Cryobacterium sp.]|nr:rane protein [Cryobacterium sp.]
MRAWPEGADVTTQTEQTPEPAETALVPETLPAASGPSLRTPLSEQDTARLAALTRMKRLALGLLAVMAVIFTVSFLLQERYPWLEYVRAAAEGGMVGAIADWFAVTALFRYPLGLRIPHTNIIANRKDEIGASLGEFVETNFLSEAVVRGKLESIGMSRRLGEWLRNPENATRVANELAVAGRATLDLLADGDIRDLIESVAREHLLEPEWGPSLGRIGERVVASGQQTAALDLFLEKTETWLAAHPEAFGRAVSDRLPGWLPRFVDRMVDDRALREVLGFIGAVREQPGHPLRRAINEYLAELMQDLQHDPATIARAEALKMELLDSPRLREFAAETWDSVKVSLGEALDDPASALRTGVLSTVMDIGARLAGDPALGVKVNAWLADTVAYIVEHYRHEIAGVITETVERWDASETTEKIELQVGKDLQFIRINGTVVGALAGLVIFAAAQALASIVVL